MIQQIPAQAVYQSEIDVKHSRFITQIAHTPNIASANAFLDEVRQLHHKANHNCWARIAGPRSELNGWGSSDDGEPKGTAGKPMLNVLSHSQLCETTIVVTRYFGGIKLGAGGIVRAYSLAVQDALKTLPTIEKIDKFTFTLELPHALVGPIETLLMKTQAEVLTRNWNEKLQLTGQASAPQLAELRQQLIPYQHQTHYQDKEMRW
ncbi:YigZ family protein [Neptuniibacter pectenicola]|uniref:YigZ family protein n=1 Tax=Neptuniibacter pectenicola TaxID=1806669 RepID=A0ABU9TP28_9GAMM